jgi:TolB-like protein/class 3 adenylate cyclase/Tfp pilus assembly protein PilF
MPQSRQLAAIMFTDIVGYTAFMDQDEELAFNLLRRNREIQKPVIEKHNGRWLKEIGDGVLASFNTASDAVYCAIEIQEICRNEVDLKLRIGIHLGEVMFEGDDIFGSGVNIASRLEPIAPVGGILVSESIYKNVRNKKNVVLDYTGEERIRGIKEPVRVYQVKLSSLHAPISEQENQPELPDPKKKTIKVSWLVAAMLLLGGFGYFIFLGGLEITSGYDGQVDDIKWIAVLPFVDMSAGQDQEYLGDGIAEELINTLVKAEDLKVIARTSSFQFKDQNIDVRDVGSTLNANYVVEGSVRKFKDQLKVTAQLIDIADGSHIWSENYDRPYNDIFAIQSEIAQAVFNEISKSLDLDIRVVNKSTTNLMAYDFYLRGEDYHNRTYGNENDNLTNASIMYESAVELDTNFTLAWVGLAKTSRAFYHWHRSVNHIQKSKEYLGRAQALEPDLMGVQFESAMQYYQLESNYRKALEILEPLRLRYPNNEAILTAFGHIYRRMGKLEKALENQQQAISLSPFNWAGYFSTAHTLTILKRYSEAELFLSKVNSINPDNGFNLTRLAQLYLIIGNQYKASEVIAKNQDEVFDEVRSYAQLLERSYDQAIDIINSSPETGISDQYKFLPKSLQLALIYYCSSETEMAKQHFSQSLRLLTDTLDYFQSDARARIHSSLGIAYAGLGKNKLALSHGEKALSIVDYSVDAIRAFYRELDMARILVMVGNYEDAVNKIEFLVNRDGYLSVELLKRDPMWDPLRQVESFNDLVNNPKYIAYLSN